MVEGTPPGDALPPHPRRATPARKGARCGAGAGSPRPHRLHPGHTGRGTLAARSRGQAAGGGTAPGTRRPSQWWKAPPPGTPFRRPHSEQRRPARTHAVGPMLGPHTRTDRTRNTRVAEPWLPAPEDGRPGEGPRLTPDAPHNGGRPPPPGTAPHHPRGTQPPQGMQAKGTVLGPHTHTPAPTARGWWTPTARPVGGQSGEGQRLTSDAPQNGGRHLPGDALPPPPERATPARTGARCGAAVGSPRPRRPPPGHTGRRIRAARPRGRAGGEATAPDTRHPSQRWQATLPGDGPPTPPRHAAPTGHAGQGDSVGPPHSHARDHSMWVADPNSPTSGRAVWGGGAPDHRRPSQRWKAPPREHPSATPTASNAGPQGRKLWAGCWVPRPHRPHPGHTGRGIPAARPRGRAAGGGTAPDTRRPSPRWQATPPGDGPPPPPRHAAPTGHAGQGDSVGPPHPHTRTHSTWVADPNSPPSGWAVGGGGAPDVRRPSQRWNAPPPGTAPHHPRGTQPPQGMQAKGTVLAPHTHTPAPTARGRRTPTARPVGGQSGEGQRLTPDAPPNGGRHPPRGRPSAIPTASNAGPQGRTL